MNAVLGSKLRQINVLGNKLKNAEVLGKKFISNTAKSAIQGAKTAEQLVNSGSKALDVGARKVSNTLGYVDRSLGQLNPYLAGTPIQGISTAIRDVAKGGQVLSNGVREGAKDLTKLSERGLAQKLENEVQRFI